METFKEILLGFKEEFEIENERIKDKIAQVRESLDWEEAPTGKNKKEFRLLHSKEAKLKTIQTLENELLNKIVEMEEFQNKIGNIMADPESRLLKLQREIAMFKKHLPVYRFRSKIIESIRDFDVTVLVADTGSGKSTLLPQFLFGHDENQIIYCAQPRRLAAHGLADYTKDCLYIGAEDYTVATDFSPWDTTFQPESSRIVYTTNFGMLHKWRKNKSLSDVDVVVIDEAHERNLATDLLLGIMKEVLISVANRTKPIKLVIMSATIDPSIFCNFFKDETVKVNNLFIPGKTYPVEMIYDKNPISNNPREYLERTIGKIKEILSENDTGDVLAFLATPAEIDEGVDNLEEHFRLFDRDIKAFPLHGNVEVDVQKTLFKKESAVQQRVILATRIAETSVTLPDITFVVDSGRQKEFTYDLVKNIGELTLSQISKTSAIQRAGRAGRVGPGICYRLYQLIDFDNFCPCKSPEIQCLPLDQSLLSLFYLGFSSPSTFNFIDPPDPDAIAVGISSLLSLNAITKKESLEVVDTYELTDLGSKMAKFNIDPRLAHLIVNTIESQRDLILEVLVICGMVSSGGNVFYRYGNYEAADFQKLKFCHPSGDFITMLEAYKRWTYVPQCEQKNWAKRNFISSKALLTVRKFLNRNIAQIEKTFRHCKLLNLRSYEFPILESYDPLLKLIYQSFKRSIAVFAGHPKTGYISPITNQRMVLHPSSSINKLYCEYPLYICIDKVMTTTKTYIFHASMVKPEWIDDEDVLYTDFVKSSLVQLYNDFPRLGSRLLRRNVMRAIKIRSAQLEEKIKNNALEKRVTNFYNIYLNLDKGLIDAYCHSENKPTLIDHVNEIVKEALTSAKAERIVLPIYGTKNNLNIGLNGIGSEVIIPGNFLTIKLPMYDFTPEEVQDTIKVVLRELKSNAQVRSLNPYETELLFTSRDDAKNAFDLISFRFPNIKPRWNQNNQRNESLSCRIFLSIRETSIRESVVVESVKEILGASMAQNVEINLIEGRQIQGKSSQKDVQLEVHSLLMADKVVEQIKNGFSRFDVKRINSCLRCAWTVPSSVATQLRNSILSIFPQCNFNQNGDDTKVILLEKRMEIPVQERFFSNFKKISELLEGTSFSRPETPLFFNSISHKERLQEIETRHHVAIIHDKYSQEYCIKIYGDSEDCQRAIEEIDKVLNSLDTVVTSINFNSEGRRPGLLLQLLKTYGTNLHRLNLKRGIISVEMMVSKGVVRISGTKDAILKVEEEIEELFANCPTVQNIDEETTCIICFTTPEKNDSYRLDLCGHLICLHQCFKLLIVSSDFPLVCPKEKCDGGGITVQDLCVAFSIGPSVKKDFMKNCLSHFMATNNVKHCPVVNCRGIYKVFDDREQKSCKITCDVCHKDVCTSCMVEYHRDLNCEQFKKGEKNNLHELMREGILKLCPKCEVPIEKNGGCLHITCIKCNAHICWYCLIDFKTSGEVYSHKCLTPR